jgi:flagellar basal body-associated protein FliL
MQFTKNTSSGKSNLVSLIVKIGLILAVLVTIVFFINKIDFPAPKKEIDKIIPNENFKIVK